MVSILTLGLAMVHVALHRQLAAAFRSEGWPSNRELGVELDLGEEQQKTIYRREKKVEILQVLDSESGLQAKEEARKNSPSGTRISRSTAKRSSPAGPPTRSPATSPSSSSPPRFPETRFTHHVNEVISVIEETRLHYPPDSGKSYNPLRSNCFTYRVVVTKPYTPPNRIECDRNNYMCVFFQRLFQSDPTRVLPFNVTVGVSGGDRIKTGEEAWGQCIASSSPKGSFAMTNFQDIMKHVGVKTDADHGWASSSQQQIDWNSRRKIPVFRGHPRFKVTPPKGVDPAKLCQANITSRGARSMAASFSFENPDLLDAVISYWQNKKNERYSCRRFNATNDSMDKLFRMGRYSKTSLSSPVKIPPEEYYTNYQTVLVLGGIGAAFRTQRHMASGQAVILQDFRFEEWFVTYMKPYQHFIPLKQDLSDLKEVMEWVRDHPEEVQQIALAGQKFYWEYLDFTRTDQHWYELLWRLSLKLQEKAPNLQSGWDHASGSAGGIGKYYAFERTLGGNFEILGNELRMWSGATVDVSAGCDFVLLHNPNFSKGLGMNIHIRKSAHASRNFIEAVVLQIGRNTLEVTAAGGIGGSHYWTHGGKVGLYLKSGHTALGDYEVEYDQINENQTSASIRLGNSGVIIIETFKENVRINIEFRDKRQLERIYHGSTGLLGSYPRGEMTARDGTTIIEDANEFAQEWMVRPTDTMLFHDANASHPRLGCPLPSRANEK